jgi:hypothetical protein
VKRNMSRRLKDEPDPGGVFDTRTS